AINHVKDEKPVDEDPDTLVERMRSFVQKYDSEIKKFGMFQRPQDTKEYLLKNPHLVCDETANQLLLWCIDLEMEEKRSLMLHVSHQCIVLQFMLQLAIVKKCDRKNLINLFFGQFENPQPEYKAAFQAELDAFRERIIQRAKVKLEETYEKIEEEEKQKRLGPGGLDPVEVMDSLPQELKDCFESRDIEMLKKVMSEMKPEDAEYHLKRCIDSGLWVENAADAEAASKEPEVTDSEEKS
ncbi:hsp90 co-chaperone Cdc37, partial [Cichlidogyrus casuarinus]